ncbi:hypothetical protein Q5P01_000104 [Channa striata]|uniref:Uncharacterized protein n=1 Tax=Channa striata TaxID=64152 RepID=A0AA88IQZ8_CHASR|nr:hypothetical protein Q5P01_000104 [Channa striata]
MLVADALISSYNKRRGREIADSTPSAPLFLLQRFLRSHRSRALCALGNRAPRRFGTQCISDRSGELRGDGAVDAGLCRTVRAGAPIPGPRGAQLLATMRPVSAFGIRTIMDISRNPPHRPRDAATSRNRPDTTRLPRPAGLGLEGTCRDARERRYLASAPEGARTGERTVDTYHQIATAALRTADPGAGPGTSSERRVQAQVGPGHGDRHALEPQLLERNLFITAGRTSWRCRSFTPEDGAAAARDSLSTPWAPLMFMSSLRCPLTDMC